MGPARRSGSSRVRPYRLRTTPPTAAGSDRSDATAAAPVMWPFGPTAASRCPPASHELWNSRCPATNSGPRRPPLPSSRRAPDYSFAASRGGAPGRRVLSRDLDVSSLASRERAACRCDGAAGWNRLRDRVERCEWLVTLDQPCTADRRAGSRGPLASAIMPAGHLWLLEVREPTAVGHTESSLPAPGEARAERLNRRSHGSPRAA